MGRELRAASANPAQVWHRQSTLPDRDSLPFRDRNSPGPITHSPSLVPQGHRGKCSCDQARWVQLLPPALPVLAVRTFQLRVLLGKCSVHLKGAGILKCKLCKPRVIGVSASFDPLSFSPLRQHSWICPLQSVLPNKTDISHLSLGRFFLLTSGRTTANKFGYIPQSVFRPTSPCHASIHYLCQLFPLGHIQHSSQNFHVIQQCLHKVYVHSCMCQI